ncbi:NAD(P)/FAD-dependent oxidoreductase [Streptomyces sp. TP-A0874]|uniref:NAD(P)/FAD-dependent oxidoreductase n=1 Tax=Streptomyces sp. TP-A0874 TaxID=549819 RepID=UPI000852D58B|nr:FAD-dependent oxidoreductase [Streptomyces sp. TP-A0874]
MARQSARTIVVAGGSLAGHTVVTELDRRGCTDEVVWVRGEEGTGPYSRPALSKEFMQEKVSPEEISLPPVEPRNIRLRVLDGVVCERLDPEADRVLVGGAWIDFDSLFVCTGMSPRVPRQFSGLAGVHALRTLGDAAAVRARLATRPRTVVVGGGLIGCEIAASLRTLGLPVELVMQDDLPMEPLVGPVLGRYCLERHQEHGVVCRTGTTVTSLTVGPGEAAVNAAFDDGTSTTADLVLLGLGAVPNTGWLEGSGLDATDGVRCDEALRTGRPGVYAAGDIARWPNPVFGRLMRVEHWTNASAQARHAVESYFADRDGRPSPAFADAPYFWSDQYGLKYQMVGHARGHDETRLETAGERPVVTYHREGRLVAAAGVNATRAVMRFKAHIQAKGRERLRGRTAEPPSSGPAHPPGETSPGTAPTR